MESGVEKAGVDWTYYEYTVDNENFYSVLENRCVNLCLSVNKFCLSKNLQVTCGHNCLQVFKNNFVSQYQFHVIYKGELWSYWMILDSKIAFTRFAQLLRISDGVAPFSKEIRATVALKFNFKECELFSFYSPALEQIPMTVLIFQFVIKHFSRQKKLKLPKFLQRKIICHLFWGRDYSKQDWDKFILFYQSVAPKLPTKKCVFF